MGRLVRFIRRLSLQWKLVLVFVGLLAAISAALALYFPGKMETVTRGWANRRAVDMTRLVAQLVSVDVDTAELGGKDDAQKVVENLEQANGVGYARVLAKDGSSYASWTATGTGVVPPISVMGPGVREHDGWLEAQAPTGKDGGATVVIGFSLGEVEAERAADARTVYEIAALIIVFGIGVSLVLGRLIARPIVDLTVVAENIVARGDLTQHIEVGEEGEVDEVGRLARSFVQMVEKLRDIPRTLAASASELDAAVGGLAKVTHDQTEYVQRQASSLAEASATTQEIKQTSLMAAGKAETVVQVAGKAEQLSSLGQESVESSIQGIQEIRAQVEAITGRISDLSERMLQVGEIIESVKDLADQSNVLALNAAIEAAKAGEFGKGFAVVAREIRSLADQSIQSTGRIREILSEIQSAIRGTVSITDEGKRKMESSMEQIRSSGENLRQMTAIVQESSQAARQIAAAVNQQNIGITQISGAIVGLNDAMENTVKAIRAAESASENLKATSGRITGIVQRFRV